MTITLTLSISLPAQTSLIQDSKGETSINLFNTLATFNFAAEEISGTYYYFKKSEDASKTSGLYLGGGLSLNSVNGKSVVFSDSKFKLNGSVSPSVGYKWDTEADRSFYLYGIYKFTGKVVTLWDSVAVTIEETSLYNHQAQIGLTFTPAQYNFVASAGVKFGSTDNAGSLTQAVFSTTASSGNNTITIDEKAIGPAGNLRKNIQEVKFLGDFLYVIERVGIPVQLRYTIPDSNSGKENFFGIGTGLFINKSEAAGNQFIGGLLIELNDITKANTKDDFSKRLTMSVMVGFPFN